MSIEKEGPFIRVYRLPEKLTNGYCFGGGVPIEFLNVDWFGTAGEPKRSELEPWLRKKRWATPGRYLVMSDAASPHLTFVFEVADAAR
ncbi:MAG: hypothetical protein IOC42_01020 [Methylobacterium sp.]|nr:hypothetical protein [Methylobacterium sp.]MCA3668465.1 hypothetical protein [Methylobacterium sp.]MCA3675487.1 hypothetical protein [Methylobacterium sp.]